MSSGGSPPSSNIQRRVELHTTHLAAYDSYEYDYAYYSDEQASRCYSSANSTVTGYRGTSSYDENEVVKAAVNISITSNGEVIIQDDGNRNENLRWELPQTIDYPSEEGFTVEHHYQPQQCNSNCCSPESGDCCRHRSAMCNGSRCGCRCAQRLSTSSRVRITSESPPCHHHCHWSRSGSQAGSTSYRIFGQNGGRNDDSCSCSRRGRKSSYAVPVPQEYKPTCDSCRSLRPTLHKVIDHSLSTQLPAPSAIYSPMTSYYHQDGDYSHPHPYSNNKQSVPVEVHHISSSNILVTEPSLSEDDMAFVTSIPIKLPGEGLNQEIDLMIPVPLENKLEVKLRFPKLKAKYMKKEIEVYIPRIVEVPVPAFEPVELMPVDSPPSTQEHIISSIRNVSPRIGSQESFVDAFADNPHGSLQYERWTMAREEYIKGSKEPLTLSSYNELALAAKELELSRAWESRWVDCG